MEIAVWEASGGAPAEEETRKGPWTAEEDIRLIQCIDVHGEGRWNSLARAAGLRRSGKSCRLRWVNYLRPDLKRGHISSDEERLILELHSRWGNRWSRIAKCLPGRTDNEIKNYWRTRMKKRAPERFDRLAYSCQGLSDNPGMLRSGTGTGVLEGNAAASSSSSVNRIADEVNRKDMHFAYPVSVHLEESSPTEQSIGAIPDQMGHSDKLPAASYNDCFHIGGDRATTISGSWESLEGFGQLLANGALPPAVSASSDVDSLTDSREGFSNGETSFWDYGVSDALWNFDDYLHCI